MSDETNVVLTQKANETGFLQDVVDVLKAFGNNRGQTTVLTIKQ